MSLPTALPLTRTPPLEPGVDSTAPAFHYEVIKQLLPDWALHSPAHKRRLLKDVMPRAPRNTHAIAPPQRTALNRAHIAHWKAHSDVEQSLETLLDIYGFAEPILKQALHSQYNVDLALDLKETFINLYIPIKLPLLNLDSGAYKTWKVSILDAALHNFEQFETEVSAHAADSGFIIKPTTAGYYKTLDTLTAQLPVPGFIELCRQLDLGGQYKTHLEQQLGIHNKSRELTLKTKVRHQQRTAFEAAMHYALAQGDISQSMFESLSSPGQAAAWTSTLPPALSMYSLTLLGAELTGVLVFAHPALKPSHNTEVVIYLPDDPQHPLKRYASMPECLAALAQNLRDEHYQHYFSRFIGHAQLGLFFSTLKRSLWRTLSDPARVPQGRPEDYPPEVRIVPIEHPVLAFTLLEITQDYTEHLYQKKRQKILADAPLIAVPTDTEDQKTRHERKARLKAIAESVLTTIEFVAAPFIPVLGELMLVQMAWQIADDTYEGIRDWSQGKTLEAWDHLFSVLETVVQTATLAAGGKVIGEALTIKPSPFVDSLKRVNLSNGEARLWEPDLSPYEHTAPLPIHVQPDEAGIYVHDSALHLRLEGKTYQIEPVSRPPGYRIKHPAPHRAYSPRLHHNGSGAWIAETESPLQWSNEQLFKRLSPRNSEFSEIEASRILAITQTDPAVLRHVISNALPTPALLADTLQRFRIDADIERSIVRMQSGDPALYRLVDPQTQLQLLTQPELWPPSRVISIVDEQGQVLTQYPSAATPGSRITVPESNMRDGELVTCVLQQLEDSETRRLIGTSPASADPLPKMHERSARLYRRLADLARIKRTELFDSRYQSLELRGSAEVTLLQTALPGLPNHAAKELIWHASGDEILQLLNEKTIAPRLLEEARWQLMESRINRAYEGMFLDAIHTPDSEWLTLKTLEAMPGWSHEVRLEIRENHFSGPLLNSLGDETAAIRKVLIKSENRYSARDALNRELHGPDDLYSALLHALPDHERQALGFLHPAQGSALKERVRAQPLLPRLNVRAHFDHPVVAIDFKSPMALVHGRASYPLLGADAPHTSHSPLETQVHELYPTLNARERARVMASLPDTGSKARARLGELERELMTLRDDLETWTLNAPAVNQRTGDILSPSSLVARVQDRRAFSQELRRAWQRQTAFDNHYADPARDGFELIFTRLILEDMPTINADFSHITYLSLNGMGPVTGINEFLQKFPRLRALELRGFELDLLPDAVFSMQNLTELRLENCAITLTQDSAAGLAALEHLEYIDLDHNPLNITPNFGNMPNLNTLHLRNTGLREFPVSLLALSELEVVDLSENLITELPSELFESAAFITEALDLEDNPLSQAALSRVREYFSQTGFDMNIALEDADGIAAVILAEPDE